MLPKTRIARIVATVSIALSLVLVAAVAWKLWLPTPEPARGGAAFGGPFELMDTRGETRSAADFRGRFMLVYFGYTHCPDVCPTTLNAMTQALTYLEEKAPETAARVTPVFVSVDPARDDVARMRDYVANFHPRLVGLTGSPAQVALAARAYHVAYETVSPEDMAGAAHAGHGDHDGDLIRHSSYIFLMGPDGGHLAHLPHTAGATRIVEMLRRHTDA